MPLDTNTDVSEVQIKTGKSPSSALFHEAVVCPLNFAKCPVKRILPQDEHVSEPTLVLIDGFKKPNPTFCSRPWLSR